jgi:hypothetical protein
MFQRTRCVSERKRPPPRNHLSREERLERWEAAAIEGTKLGPCPITGDDRTHYVWLRLISLSSLPALTRLLAHSLALFGDAKGQSRDGSVDGVYPSIRELAKRSGLSERSTCTHAEALVRTAWLQRERYRVRMDRGAWDGVLYRFCLPVAVLRAPENAKIIVPRWLWKATVAESAATPVAAGAATPVQRSIADLRDGADSAAERVERQDAGSLTEPQEGVERNDGGALNAVQSRFPSEVLRRGSHSEVLTQGAGARSVKAFERKKDPEEQIRKALKHLAADPSADVCKLYHVSPEEVRQRRNA